MKKTNQKKSGFTLIEILIVVVIIAVLAAIATPVYLGGKRKADSSAKLQNASAYKSAIAFAIADGVVTGETTPVEMEAGDMLAVYGVRSPNMIVAGETPSMTITLGADVSAIMGLSAEALATRMYATAP